MRTTIVSVPCECSRLPYEPRFGLHPPVPGGCKGGSRYPKYPNFRGPISQYPNFNEPISQYPNFVDSESSLVEGSCSTCLRYVFSLGTWVWNTSLIRHPDFKHSKVSNSNFKWIEVKCKSQIVTHGV